MELMYESELLKILLLMNSKKSSQFLVSLWIMGWIVSAGYFFSLISLCLN